MVARPLSAQVGLGLVPMRVEFPATPGRPFAGSLALSNGATAKVRVRVELLDLYVDDTMTRNSSRRRQLRLSILAAPG